MTRSPSAALMPLAQARLLLTKDIVPVAAQMLPLAAAPGRIAAADVTAPAALPRRIIATRDGWAVEAAAVAGAGPYSPVPFGRAPPWLDSGEDLPEGTETMLPPEAVAISAGAVEAIGEAAPGEGTRAPGGDLAVGTVLASAGRRIAPIHVLGLAAAGLGELAVRIPRLHIVTAGAVRGGADADALGPFVAALCPGWGAEVTGPTSVGDSAAAIAAALLAGAADAVVLIGGTGVGRADRSAAGLALAGEVRAHGIALRPGETAGFGLAAGRPVLLVPGRVEAGLASVVALGMPLIAALAGAIARPPREACLTRKVTSTIGLSEIVFIRHGAGGAEPLGGDEIPLATLLTAAGFLVVPPEREGYAAGTAVEITPL